MVSLFSSISSSKSDTITITADRDIYTGLVDESVYFNLTADKKMENVSCDMSFTGNKGIKVNDFAEIKSALITKPVLDHYDIYNCSNGFNTNITSTTAYCRNPVLKNVTISADIPYPIVEITDADIKYMNHVTVSTDASAKKLKKEQIMKSHLDVRPVADAENQPYSKEGSLFSLNFDKGETKQIVMDFSHKADTAGEFTIECFDSDGISLGFLDPTWNATWQNYKNSSGFDGANQQGYFNYTQYFNVSQLNGFRLLENNSVITAYKINTTDYTTYMLRQYTSVSSNAGQGQEVFNMQPINKTIIPSQVCISFYGAGSCTGYYEAFIYERLSDTSLSNHVLCEGVSPNPFTETSCFGLKCISPLYSTKNYSVYINNSYAVCAGEFEYNINSIAQTAVYSCLPITVWGDPITMGTNDQPCERVNFILYGGTNDTWSTVFSGSQGSNYTAYYNPNTTQTPLDYMDGNSWNGWNSTVYDLTNWNTASKLITWSGQSANGNLPPIIWSNFTSPATPVQGRLANITVNCSDSDGFVNDIRSNVTFPNTTTMSFGNNLTSTDGVIWNSTNFYPNQLGWYNITTECNDSSGSTVSSLIMFNLTNVPPLIRSNSTLPAAPSQRSYVSAVVNCTDYDNYVNSVTGNVTFPNGTTMRLSNFTYNISNTWNSTAFYANQLGRYNITFNCTDDNGIPVSSMLSFNITNIPPTFYSNRTYPNPPIPLYTSLFYQVVVNDTNTNDYVDNVTMYCVMVNNSKVMFNNTNATYTNNPAGRWNSTNFTVTNSSIFNCTAVATDSWGAQSRTNMNFTVTSDVPKITNISISPLNPMMNCSVVATDLYNTSLLVNFSWWHNGTEDHTWDNSRSCGNNTLCWSSKAPPSIKKYDNYTCLANVYDNIDWSTPKNISGNFSPMVYIQWNFTNITGYTMPNHNVFYNVFPSDILLTDVNVLWTNASGYIFHNTTNATKFNLTGSLIMSLDFNMNASSANYIYDASGIANATVVNATWNPSSLIGGAYSFLGTNSYVNSTLNSNYSDFNFPSQTISIWFYLYNHSGYIGTGSDGRIQFASCVNNWRFQTYNGTTSEQLVSFYLQNESSVSPIVKITSNLQFGTWYNAVITFNSTNISLYVNGVFNETITHNIRPNGTNKQVVLGSQSQGYLNGSVDQVMIWNRSLTGTEITQLYATQSASQWYDSFAPTIPNIYTIMATATDIYNISTSANYTLNVSDNPPIINLNLTYYANGSLIDPIYVLGNSTLFLSVNATDYEDISANAINASILYPDSTMINLSNFTSCLNNLCNSSSFVVPMFGRYNVTIYAYDIFSVQTSSSYGFYVDNQPQLMFKLADYYIPSAPYLNDYIVFGLNLSSLSYSLKNVTANLTLPSGAQDINISGGAGSCIQYSTGYYQCNSTNRTLANQAGAYNVKYIATDEFGNTQTLYQAYPIFDSFRYSPSSISESMTQTGHNLTFNVSVYDTLVDTNTTLRLSILLQDEKNSSLDGTNFDFATNITVNGVKYDNKAYANLNHTFNAANSTLNFKVDILDTNTSIANRTRTGVIMLDRIWKDGTYIRANISLTYAVNPPAGHFFWLASDNSSCGAGLCSLSLSVPEGSSVTVTFNLNNTGGREIDNILGLPSFGWLTSITSSFQNISVGQVTRITANVNVPGASGGNTQYGFINVNGTLDGFGKIGNAYDPSIPRLIIYSIAASPGTVASGTSGGGSSTPSILQPEQPYQTAMLGNESLFKITINANQIFAGLTILPNESQDYTIYVTNLKKSNAIDLSIACQKGGQFSICNYVSFSKNEIRLIPQDEQSLTMTIRTPEKMNWGDKSYFEVRAVETNMSSVPDAPEALLKIDVDVSRLAYIALNSNAIKGMVALSKYMITQSPVSPIPFPEFLFFIIIPFILVYLLTFIKNEGLMWFFIITSLLVYYIIIIIMAVNYVI